MYLSGINLPRTKLTADGPRDCFLISVAFVVLLRVGCLWLTGVCYIETLPTIVMSFALNTELNDLRISVCDVIEKLGENGIRGSPCSEPMTSCNCYHSD